MEKPDAPENSSPSPTGAAPSKPKKPRNLLFIFLVLGLFAGSIFPLVRALGIFNSWQKLAIAPVKSAILLGTDSFWSGPGSVYLRAEDGTVYAYDTGTKVWSSNLPPGEIMSQDCQSQVSVKFFPGKRPFGKPYQCAQVSGHGDIAPPLVFIFVLDEPGNLWGWTDEAGMMLFCLLPMFAAGGLLAGLFANFAWMIVRRLRLNRSATASVSERVAVRAQETRILRWVTRLWSLLGILLLLLNDAHDSRGFFNQSTAVLGAAGLALGWFLPLPGGALALLVFLLRLLVIINKILNLVTPPGFLEINRYVSTFMIIFDIVIFMPGLLYLWGWFSARKLRQEKATEALK